MGKLINKLIEKKNNIKYHYVDKWNLKKARKVYGIWNPPNPLISIILPTRNRWDILKDRALPSVLNQIYKNWELIIIDDDSDNCNLKETGDNRIKYYNLSPKIYHYPKTAFNRWCAGPVKALNYGLSKVKGDWIARLDDDDEWHPDMLEKMLKYAQQNNYEYVSALWTDEDDVFDPRIWNVYELGNDISVGGIQTSLYRSYLKCFKYNPDCWRKSWNKVNDIDLQVRMVKAGVRFGFLPEVVCTIRPRPGQTTIGLDAQVKEYKDNVEG